MMGENCPPESLRSSSLTSFPQGVNGFRNSGVSPCTMTTPRPQTQWMHPPQSLLLLLCSGRLPPRFLCPLTKMRFPLLHHSTLQPRKEGHKLISIIFKVPHTQDVTRYLSFSVGLTSLCMIVSRFIHVAANGIISFFIMAESYCIVHMSLFTK